jgi:hypothetical protein
MEYSYYFVIFGKDWEMAAGFHSYARVERALAYAFELAPDQRARMTVKLKSLQKQGLGASEQIPGARAEYSGDDVDRWLVAIALLNSCLDPAIVARTIAANWSRAKGASEPRTTLQEIVAKARATPNNDDGERGLFLFLQLSAVHDTAEPLQEGKLDESGDLVTIGYFHPLEISKRTGKPRDNWKLFFSDLSGSRTRVAIPLSLLVHRLDHALSMPRGELS